ncbi:hypothetical protein ACHAXR_003120 [Thalassiosira sp. AJA248-18]
MGRRCHHHLSTLLGIAIAAANSVSSLMVLSDLPTPSFIIDTGALHRRVIGPPTTGEQRDASIFAPNIRCPRNELLMCPSMIRHENGHELNEKTSVTIDCDFQVVEGQPAIGYLHSSVIRAREDAIPGQDDPLSTFLAEIDLDPTLCGDAQLVLGLNNHHVGGYYWARSAGTGSSMEAPGVWFGSTGDSKRGSKENDSMENNRGVLRWLNEEGPTACNSNDGKRSEWVNFLRKSDTVQLVPADGQGALLQFFGKQCETSIRVFGISSQGRPMGSEPEVVCEWKSG